MLTRRSSSPFDLFDRLEQQLSQQLQIAERVSAAELHETPEAEMSVGTGPSNAPTSRRIQRIGGRYAAAADSRAPVATLEIL